VARGGLGSEDQTRRPRVEAEEFQQFTAAVAAQNRSIAAIAWAQTIRRDQRADFELASGVRILERGEDENFIPAGERDSYVPVILENRFDKRAPAVGFAAEKVAQEICSGKIPVPKAASHKAII
jgi:hypothetical protein